MGLLIGAYPTIIMDYNSRIFHTRNIRVTESTQLPIALNDVKNFLRLNDSTIEEDALLTLYIKSAWRYIEGYTNRVLLTETYQLRLDFYPTKYFQMVVDPIQSITNIQYIDTNGDIQTVASSNYDVDLNSKPAKIYTYRFDIPSYDTERMDTVSVNYIAGYASKSLIPHGLVSALLMIVSYLYENRAAASMVNIMAGKNYFFNSLLDQYTLPVWA